MTLHTLKGFGGSGKLFWRGFRIPEMASCRQIPALPDECPPGPQTHRSLSKLPETSVTRTTRELQEDERLLTPRCEGEGLFGDLEQQLPGRAFAAPAAHSGVTSVCLHYPKYVCISAGLHDR